MIPNVFLAQTSLLDIDSSNNYLLDYQSKYLITIPNITNAMLNVLLVTILDPLQYLSSHKNPPTSIHVLKPEKSRRHLSLPPIPRSNESLPPFQNMLNIGSPL